MKKVFHFPKTTVSMDNRLDFLRKALLGGLGMGFFYTRKNVEEELAFVTQKVNRWAKNNKSTNC